MSYNQYERPQYGKGQKKVVLFDFLLGLSIGLVVGYIV